MLLFIIVDVGRRKSIFSLFTGVVSLLFAITYSNKISYKNHARKKNHLTKDVVSMKEKMFELSKQHKGHLHFLHNELVHCS